MSKKAVIFALRSDPMCFIHTLLNALDLNKKGRLGIIVLEGEACSLIPEICKPGHMLFPHYEKAKKLGLIYGACRACSFKMKVAEAAEKEGIQLLGDMSGHPSIASFLEKDFDVVTL